MSMTVVAMLALAGLSALPPASAAPTSNATGLATGLTAGKDTSDGRNFELNVFYSLQKTPDCKDTPDAQITAAPDECRCLDKELGLCVASVKLGVEGKGSDEKITADLYVGGDCSGTPLLGGNTELECNTCNVAPIGHSAGIAVEFICPFSAGGLCPEVGVGIGEPCIASVAACAAALVICCCCLCKMRKTNRQQPVSVQYAQPFLGSE
jgi:hypothetical protein